MKAITHKHILIVEVEILQSETNYEHLQTTMRVLNEMTYENYLEMIESVNLIKKLKHFFEAKE